MGCTQSLWKGFYIFYPKKINWGSWKIGKHSMDSWGFKKKKKVWVLGREQNLMQKSHENM